MLSWRHFIPSPPRVQGHSLQPQRQQCICQHHVWVWLCGPGDGRGCTGTQGAAPGAGQVPAQLLRKQLKIALVWIDKSSAWFGLRGTWLNHRLFSMTALFILNRGAEEMRLQMLKEQVVTFQGLFDQNFTPQLLLNMGLEGGWQSSITRESSACEETLLWVWHQFATVWWGKGSTMTTARKLVAFYLMGWKCPGIMY